MSIHEDLNWWLDKSIERDEAHALINKSYLPPHVAQL